MPTEQTILVIDDDKNIRRLVRLYLEKEGFAVVECGHGDEAMGAFDASAPSLVVLDVMLPGLDGWQLLELIRKKSAVPIIMLTAKGETLERIHGLELGADDYMPKPFDPKELVARIKAVIRRSAAKEGDKKQLDFKDLTISLENYQVTLSGQLLEMPPKEIELLHFLASHEGKVFTREQLLESVWGFEFFGDSRTVDVHVKRIREKLGEHDAWQIKTVWGVGYKFQTQS
ncbi:Transcriptional regulatory protein SrrA [bioreactor metagenome]|uniref:Transcriptional regulatory protein SrrA n=1 Tax=bioreactor metagenome TaxID=1076179 RepID=A0A645BYV1_9ZZZZ